MIDFCIDSSLIFPYFYYLPVYLLLFQDVSEHVINYGLQELLSPIGLHVLF